ncbi:hypothetical protein [Macrococcus brunensis]|uniref:hypothetical protein n=1 Tax=Macrococcus brunensis TaxID=198483 RepID=UPI001EF0574B|nr:hypothetical protein [Macrococcus brunensis]ULG74532.1 hypothetical protein MGG13_01810 [Macrococcus brunensis]
MNDQTGILIFESEELANITESFEIDKIEKVELSKPLLNETLGIYYKGDWYKWTYFLDEHYKEIYSQLAKK